MATFVYVVVFACCCRLLLVVDVLDVVDVADVADVVDVVGVAVVISCLFLLSLLPLLSLLLAASLVKPIGYDYESKWPHDPVLLCHKQVLLMKQTGNNGKLPYNNNSNRNNSRITMILCSDKLTNKN